MPITRIDADQIATTPKRIGEEISWRNKAHSEDRFFFEVIVVAVEKPNMSLRLIGNAGKTNWSFTLLTGNTVIRKLTKHAGGHRNPDGSNAGPEHKHIWDPATENQETYFPIDIDFKDVNKALTGFLLECQIECTSSPKPLNRQMRLP